MTASRYRLPSIAAMRPALVLTLGVLLTACAGGLARKDDAAQFRYQDYAGEPVDTVDSMGRVTGWNSVSRDQLVIWTGVNDAWLIKVWSTCRDLEFANTVAIKEERCQISEIRPVDIKQMKADRAAAKAKP